MILICVATDVAPALSMCFEPPEQGLLSRPPRDVKKERLADWRLLLQAYAFLGVLESLCAMGMCVDPSYTLQRTVVNTKMQVVLVPPAQGRPIRFAGPRLR
jgi:magnesium-transporting ATPase (P-type)